MLSASVLAASGLGILTAPVAQAALPGTPGLLAGSKVMPNGGVTTGTEKLDGSRLVLDLTASGGTDQGGGVTWSPDGKHVALVNGAPGIEIYSPNATGVRDVSETSVDPAFTPDGSTIIATGWDAGSNSDQLRSIPSSWDLIAQNGKENQTPWFSTPTGGTDRYPTVSATTGTVYFEHTTATGKDVWTDHGDHTAGLLISDGRQPDISPDGSKLAFVRAVAGYAQIFEQAADGSGSATQLTSGSVNHTHPKWAPSGLALDYDANPGTDYVNTTGRHLVLATKADTLIPNGLFDVTEQPTAPTSLGVGSTFHTTGPTRLLDTRYGTGMVAPNAVPAMGTVPLLVEGAKGLPASGISAVVLNVTVTSTKASGFLSAYPEGTAASGASNLNWTAGQTIANQVIVPVGADGEIDLYNRSSGTAQVVADISGYFTADGSGALFTAAGPARVLDTRAANGVTTKTPVAANGTVSLQVAGRGGLPQSGVSAVVLNVTATDTRTAGFATVYPDGTPKPNASNLNWTAGQTIANHVLVPVGADGKVELATHSAGTVDLVADVFGYFSASGTATYHTTAPTRLLDTRQSGGAIAARGTRSLSLAGTVVPASVKAVVLNVTATDTKLGGFLTAYPDGTNLPTSSNLNWSAGQTVPNLVTLRVVDGKIDFHNASGGSVDVVADVFGYYTD
ncbi:TolB family protein [Streptacidiphilus rugosus]|uniref:TolB family protein n=1 Tax=Streptacidiphilus rugosus TaxID=405783 RepID=UPI00068B03F6|nr:PD40 domain-containing protein [Streptacidiphilus rugosus]